MCGYEKYVWKEGRSIRCCQIGSNASKLFYYSDPILIPFEEGKLLCPTSFFMTGNVALEKNTWKSAFQEGREETGGGGDAWPLIREHLLDRIQDRVHIARSFRRRTL